MKTKKTTMRLDEETLKLLDLLSQRLGGNHTTIMKQAVRTFARKENVSTKQEGNVE